MDAETARDFVAEQANTLIGVFRFGPALETEINTFWSLYRHLPGFNADEYLIRRIVSVWIQRFGLREACAVKAICLLTSPRCVGKCDTAATLIAELGRLCADSVDREMCYQAEHKRIREELM